MEIGLRYWDGSQVQEIPVLTDYANCPIRIVKNGVTYGVPTVDVSSPDALPIRVKLPSGIEALGYTVPIVPPTVLIQNIVLWDKSVFRNWYTAYAQVYVKDAGTGLPLVGASVEVIWSNAYNATMTAVTNGSGVAAYSTPWVTRDSYITITINKVFIGGVEQEFTGTPLSATKRIG